MLLVCLAALVSALFARNLWLFLTGTVAGGVTIGFVFRGGLSELNRLAEPRHRAAVVSTFFAAAEARTAPVAASVYTSGLAAATVVVAFVVVGRSFGAAAGGLPRVKIADSALGTAVRPSHRYISDRFAE